MSLVDKIANAIAREEGYFNPANLPHRLNNPGDLNFAGQAGATPFTEPGRATPYAQFPTIALGVTALYRQIWADIAKGETLRTLIVSWAPAQDGNSPGSYLQNVMTWTGLTNPDAKLLDLVAAEWLAN